MRARFCLLDTDATDLDGRAAVRLWGKAADGKTVCVLDDSFEPYFWVLPAAGREAEVKNKIEARFGKAIKRVEIAERWLGLQKRKFLKVVCHAPGDLPKVRGIVKMWERKHGGIGLVEEEYEYTIPHWRRYLIERGFCGMGWLEVEGELFRADWQADIVLRAKSIKRLARADPPPLRLLAFDIENIEEAGKQKIIALSLAGPRFRKVLTYQTDRYPGYVEVVADERALLERFVQAISAVDPDILLGFMSDEHDFQIIQQRATELKVPLALSRDRSPLRFMRGKVVSRARLRGRIHIDLFSFVLDILAPQLQTEVMTLGAIAAELLGDTKIEMEFEEILEAWRKKKDLAKLAEYCLKDSELVLRLANLLLPQIWELCRVVGQLPFDISRMTYGQLVEWYLMRRAHELGYVIPSKPKFEEIAERLRRPAYVGGYVKEPAPGLHERIAVLDFKSVDPREPVVALSPDGVPIVTQVGALVDDLLACGPGHNGAVEVAEADGWKVLCFDEKQKVVFAPISQVSRHSNTAPLLRVRTRTGRWIRVTPGHSLFKLQNFEPRAVTASELKVGDYIVIPRRVQLPEIFNGHFNLLHVLDGPDVFVIEPKMLLTPAMFARRRRFLELLTEPRAASWMAKQLGISITAVSYFAARCKKLGLIGAHGKCYRLTESGRRWLDYAQKAADRRRYEPNSRTYRCPAAVVRNVLLSWPTEQLTGWRIGMRNCKHTIPIVVETGPLAAVLGWYVAEGCMSTCSKTEPWRRSWEKQYKVAITPVQRDQIDEIAGHCRALGWHLSRRSDGIVLSSKLYYTIFDGFRGGCEAHNKRIPPWLLLFDSAARRSFLSAYLAGDGHLYGPHATAASVSAELINELGLLAASLGYDYTLFSQPDRQRYFNGRVIRGSPSYWIVLRGLAALKRFSRSYARSLPRVLHPALTHRRHKLMALEELKKWAVESDHRAAMDFLNGDLAVDEVVSIEAEPTIPQVVYDIGVNPKQNFITGFGWIAAHNSLYPSIIASFNISPETLNVGAREAGWQVPGERFWFCKRPRGFVAQVIGDLIERRKRLKTQLTKARGVERLRLLNEQQAVKTVANATYGMMGFAGATWYCVECAQSAAAFGRHFIKKVIERAEQSEFDVIYADTDSCFVKLRHSRLEAATSRFLKGINAELPGLLELDLQGYYRRGIFIPLEARLGAAKKRYALIDARGNLTIRGIERVRADWCWLARATQEEVLRLLLTKRDIKGAVKAVKSAIARLTAGKVPLRDLAIYETLSKPLAAYKVVSPHTVVARKMAERGRPIGVGMVMIYVITKGKASISQRAEPLEDVSFKDIDIDYYIEKQIIPPSLRVLAAVGVSREQLAK